MPSSSSSTRANRGSHPIQVNNTFRSSPTSLSGQSRSANKHSNNSKSESSPSSKHSHKPSSKRSSKSSKQSSKSSSQSPSKSASTQSENSIENDKRLAGHINGTLPSSATLERYASSQILSTPIYTICPVVLSEDATRARAQALIEQFDDEMELLEKRRPEEGESRN